MAIGATVSPSGVQVIGDGQNPRIFTGVATEDIKAGGLVCVNAAQTAQKVGSTTSTFNPTDLEILYVKDEVHCNGIALKTVSSGTSAYIPVATRGTYLLRAAGIISGGQSIVPFSGTIQGVQNQDVTIAVTSGTVSSTGTIAGETVIGRSKTNSASGTNLYILADLNL